MFEGRNVAVRFAWPRRFGLISGRERTPVHKTPVGWENGGPAPGLGSEFLSEILDRNSQVEAGASFEPRVSRRGRSSASHRGSSAAALDVEKVGTLPRCTNVRPARLRTKLAQRRKSV